MLDEFWVFDALLNTFSHPVVLHGSNHMPAWHWLIMMCHLTPIPCFDFQHLPTESGEPFMRSWRISKHLKTRKSEINHETSAGKTWLTKLAHLRAWSQKLPLAIRLPWERASACMSWDQSKGWPSHAETISNALTWHGNHSKTQKGDFS